MGCLLLLLECRVPVIGVALGSAAHTLTQVLYGMDYISSEREQQHRYLRAGVLDHLQRFPQSLLVIEEYDKLDCPTRAMLRQLIENSHAANVSMDRCAPPFPPTPMCVW